MSTIVNMTDTRVGIVVKALWNALRGRHKIRRNKWKSICRAALLNDNAPDSELCLTRVRVRSGAAIFLFLQYHVLFIIPCIYSSYVEKPKYCS